MKRFAAGRLWMVLRIAPSISFLLVFCVHSAAEDAPAPVPVSKAVESISLQDGFQATLFAGEPDVVQPIAMTTDARGRLWVVECLSYPNWTTNKTGHDRVSIFEDSDGDGKFDKKRVFWDEGRNLSGIALGFGGVWLCSLPELIFVPDRDGDDKPDGPPEVLLDGWDLNSKHNAFNGLNWGPDGWLYGCNGILGNCHVGKPGTPENERTSMNCGVWRYHPQRKVFEVVATGTTNPWGIAFNETGQMFVANCVIKHLFHIIPGAHYDRMYGQDFSPYYFQLIPSIADHIHWAGGAWNVSGRTQPQNDVMGGGHAHCGAMIYLGENWPDQYRNTFFTINIHGHRVNNDLLEPEGSGYVGKHGHDFLRVNDTWFRGVALVPSHDGGMYVSDWCDAGECHDYDDIHRENGRIYKVMYNGAHNISPDFRKFRDNDLINFQTAKDEWMVNKSRLILQKRAEERNLQPTTAGRLRELFKNGNDLHARLRALWALHAIGESGTVIEAALIDPEEYIRGWAVQLALDNGARSESTARAISELPNMARNDPSPVVRLFLASALQRIPPDACAKTGAGLASHAEDAGDHNLPLMIWYGIEPVVSSNEQAALDLLKEARIPILRRFIAQRLALKMQLGGIVSLLASGTDETNGSDGDIVSGMFEALHGRRQLTAPENWDAALARLRKNPEKEVRQKALSLAVTFGDEKVLDRLKDEASDKGLPAEDRKEALEAVTQTRDSGLVPWLQKNVSDPAVRDSSIKALAAYDDPNTPKLLVGAYPKLSREEKSDAINTLASRAAYALPLLQAVEQKKIPAKDVTPFFVRQMRAYKNPAIHKLLNRLGTVRDVAPDKAAQIAKYKALLTPDALRLANLEKGRAVFQHTCASCHTLFDEGGKLAPELTGAQRSNLDYILENVVDPSAVVPERYKAAYFETSDDRLISGIVQQENESTITIQTQTGPVTLPRADVVKQTQSNVSLMPEGLLASLSEDEIVNLVAYLQSPHQVPAAPQHTTDNH